VIQIGAPMPAANEPCTLIVTGVARSGTSMLAQVLNESGIYMGEHLFPVVMEDAHILTALQSGHDGLLRQIIEQRNAAHAVWGFKVPNLHAYLRAERLGWFRNPRLIVTFRDPVAVAVRDSLSEHFDVHEAMTLAAHAVIAITAFVERAGCPAMMLSYEKAIAKPTQLLQALLPFCGIQADADLMERLIRVVMPNNPAYLATANARFEGYLEGVMQDRIYGWCRQIDFMEPVLLDLFANESRIATFLADEFREDLANIGIGNGSHGFYYDISRFNLSPDTVLHIRPSRRVLELSGSGRTIRELTVTATRGDAPDITPAPAPAGAPGPAAAR